MTVDQETGIAEWVRKEQVYLWTDLGDAISHAINGIWSIRAANIARRIVEAARLVGATPYGEIPWSLVAGDVYSTLLAIGTVPIELPDETEWRRLDDLMSRHGLTREKALLQFEQTRAEMKSPREARFIRDGDE